MRKEEKIGLFIYIFFLFFGPKIGAYIDTSIIASIIIILITVIKNDRKVVIEKYAKDLTVLLGIIIVYSLIISMANSYFDLTFFGRIIRSLISIISISIIIKDKKDIDVDELNEIIILVLLIHAVIVIISSTVYINLQYLLRRFNGYNKTIRMYRSTGLMMGFDMSGLLCNLGLVLSLCRKRWNYLYLAIFSVATLFTSRFSIVFLVFVAVFYIVIGFRNNKSLGRKILLTVIGVIVAIFGISLLIITTKSFSFAQSKFSSLFPHIYQIANKVNLAYKINDDFDMSNTRHFAINKDFFIATFGTGVYGGADPGYTRFINCIGIVGLLEAIVWHFYAVKQSVNRMLTNPTAKFNRAFIIVSIVLVLIFLNFKNCYFFTGTFFEFMMLQLCMFKYSRRYQE